MAVVGLGQVGWCRRLPRSPHAAAHLCRAAKNTLFPAPRGGFARQEQMVLTVVVFADTGERQRSLQCIVQGGIHAPGDLGMSFGREGHDRHKTGTQRALKKWGFCSFFYFPEEALMLEVADETLRWKPCLWTPLGCCWAVPGSPCLQLLPAGSGVSSASSFLLAPKGHLHCHRVPWPLALPPRCDLFKAPEMLPGRDPGKVSRSGLPSQAAVHHPGALRADPSLPVSLSPSLPVPAGQPQHCRVGRPCCGCGELMPHSKHSAQAGRAWSFFRTRLQPSTPNPGGKKALTVDISAPCASPVGGFASLGHRVAPPSPSHCRWLRSRLPHGSSAAVPPWL